jgi:hypothetical protein
MTYKINGTALTLQPTTGEWIDRDSIGATGEGHNVYPALRSFRLQWGFMTAAEFEQIHDFFENNNITGTVVAELPKYKDSSWGFYGYTGSVLREPTFGEYFEEHYSDVSLLIVRIRT